MRTVLYTQRVEIIESYKERRDCADQRIAEFIYACGYLPAPLPNKSGIAEAFIEATNPAGIILTGGNSLVKYGGNAPERDEMDNKIIQLSIDKRIPLYGFCRGMQSILEFFGNDLVNVRGHVAVRHDLLGEITRNVNSFHNQACVGLKSESNMEVLAITQDGVIEAVRHNKYPIFATMWHPERETGFNKKDIMNIKNLFMEEKE